MSNSPTTANGAAARTGGSRFHEALEALRLYREAPSPLTEGQLRAARNALVQAMLGMPRENVAHFANRQYSDAFLALMRSGLRVLAPTDEEMALIEAAASLTDTTDPIEQVRALVAFCLMLAPHHLPRLCDLGAIDPSLHELALRVLLTEPEFFVAIGEADRYAAYVERVVAHVRAVVEGEAAQPARQNLARQFVSHSRFVSVYFSERNLRSIYRDRAAVTEQYLTWIGQSIEHTFPPAPAGRRVRVGVLRGSWLGGAETAATLAHINGLDRDRFEIVLYAANSRPEHPVEREARARADRFEVVDTSNVPEAVARLRADDLDVLLTGTNLTAIGNGIFVMSAHRMARVQIAATLCPATSGLRAVDYFLNGALNEPADAQEEYTERLLLVPGAINRYDFAGEQVPPPVTVARSQIGVPDDAFTFISGANFYKLIPELLDAWAEVLAATGGSRLVLYPFNPNWTNAYPMELFSRHVRGLFQQRGVAPWRVRILRPLPTRAHIHAVIRCADLYLDSFPYSGAVSVIDPVEAAVPVLLREGRPARARQSSAFFKDVGISGVLTSSTDAYVAEAIALAGDPDRLGALRAKAEGMRGPAAAWTTLDLNEALAGVVLAAG